MSLPALHAQQNITVAGGESSGVGGTVSYSIGQVAYTTNSGSTGTVSEGVQQPYLEIMVNTHNSESIASIKLFPNPSSSFTNIVLDPYAGDYDLATFSYQLYDVYGNHLSSANVQSTFNKIGTAHLTSGMYILKVLHNAQPIKTFRFIKTD